MTIPEGAIFAEDSLRLRSAVALGTLDLRRGTSAAALASWRNALQIHPAFSWILVTKVLRPPLMGKALNVVFRTFLFGTS